MKKYILFILTASVLAFASCDVETNEEAGGTAVEKMAGTWTVTFTQSVDEYEYLFEGGTNPQLDAKAPAELDKLQWEDMYGTGKVTVLTSNTAANVATEMWLIDKNFWNTQVRCNVNYGERTFECRNQTPYEGCTMDVIGGKILEGAAVTPRGVAADSIIAYVKYSDDQQGFTYMKMSGYRYTGYAEDK